MLQMIECLNKKDCRHVFHKNNVVSKATCSLMLYTSWQNVHWQDLMKKDDYSRQYFQVFGLTKRVITQQLLISISSLFENKSK